MSVFRGQSHQGFPNVLHRRLVRQTGAELSLFSQVLDRSPSHKLRWGPDWLLSQSGPNTLGLGCRALAQGGIGRAVVSLFS
jgi:hypothetical protein